MKEDGIQVKNFKKSNIVLILGVASYFLLKFLLPLDSLSSYILKNNFKDSLLFQVPMFLFFFCALIIIVSSNYLKHLQKKQQFEHSIKYGLCTRIYDICSMFVVFLSGYLVCLVSIK
ncbi:hypothetical protein M301_0009 [Methylotenera versatilis 301]|uniref:Uncharacterized protein n=1 Tax=Methylotenera versatilis (strain 301) TaxID=666681 RepID=D7DJN8_METV0|nr:hypothetical protein M301_0009 [Methylotenera versatilis 301]